MPPHATHGAGSYPPAPSNPYIPSFFNVVGDDFELGPYIPTGISVLGRAFEASESETPLNIDTLLDLQPAGPTDQYEIPKAPDLVTPTYGTSPQSDSGSSGSLPFTSYSSPYTAGGLCEASPARLGFVESNSTLGTGGAISDGSGSSLCLALDSLSPYAPHAGFTASGSAGTTPYSSHSSEAVVLPQLATATATAKRKFKNQRLIADIEEMRGKLPADGPLNKLIGRMLATDWLYNDDEEPTYSRALGLTAGLDGLTLRDGQSVFLAFRDAQQGCILCLLCPQRARKLNLKLRLKPKPKPKPNKPKPNRMVGHIRSHFGLRPFECQSPSCVSCKDV